MSAGAARKHRRRIQRELAENPAWQVTLGDAWLCPYCGEAARRDPDPELPDDIARIDLVTDHLAICRRWEAFAGEPLPLGELRRRVDAARMRERVRAALLSRPAWQLYDVSRRWYCPFCAQATSVRVKEGGRISSSVLRRIEHHLGECVAWADGEGEERPLAYLRSMVAYANRTRKMAEQIRTRIETDAAWRLRDADGRWVCPFCRRVLEHIDFSSAVQMVETAPLEIARHLVSACERFGASARRAGAPPGAGAAEIARLGAASTTEVMRLSGAPPVDVSGELRPVVEPRRGGPSESGAGLEIGGIGASPGGGPTAPAEAAPAAASPAKRRPAGAGDWRQAIDSELAAVRTSVEETRGAGGAPVEGGDGAGDPPGLPDVEGLEIRTFQRTARPEPMDLLEVVELGPGRVAVAVGTVSTDGSDRGLFLPMARSFLRLHAGRSRSPRAVLRRMNADLCMDEESKSFVAVTLVVIDQPALRLTCARAGAPPPAIYHESRGGPTWVDGRGMVVGLRQGAVFDGALEEREEVLRPGDLVVLHTHGVVAAEDLEHQELGLEAFERLIVRYGRHEADYLVVKLGRFFEGWTRGAPLADDATLVAVKLRDR